MNNLEYPKELRELHNDWYYPLAPGSQLIKRKSKEKCCPKINYIMIADLCNIPILVMLKKLMPNFFDKEKYVQVLHYENLQL